MGATNADKEQSLAGGAEPGARRGDEGANVSVYLARSHPWLHDQFTEHGLPRIPGVTYSSTRRDAEMIIYLKPPWPDDSAPDRLRDFTPGELLRTYVYSQEDQPFPWAPGVYASISVARAKEPYVGGFYVAHHHHEEGGLDADLEAARRIEPDLLWSFVGTMSNHPSRIGLAQVRDPRAVVEDTQAWSDKVRWGWSDQYQEEGRQAFSGFAAMLGRSSFVVCPRGRGASSIRLFEALQIGRCPVIVSDDWLAPPFVDWDSCSIRVAEADVAKLPELLREREPEAAELGSRGRQVWEELYAPERRLETLIRSCMEVRVRRRQRPAVMARASMNTDALRLGLRATKRWLR